MKNNKNINSTPWLQTGATHYPAQLGLLDKCRSIKGFVVCFVEWLGSMIYWMVFGHAHGA